MVTLPCGFLRGSLIGIVAYLKLGVDALSLAAATIINYGTTYSVCRVRDRTE